MEQTKQAEELLKTWQETQKEMWDRWSKLVPGMPSFQPTAMWETAVEASKVALYGFLDAQVEWTKMWAAGMTAGALLPEAIDWVEEVVGLVEGWNEAQAELWDKWFAAVKQFEPAAMAKFWETETKKVGQAWQEAAEKATDAQKEWIELGVAKTNRKPSKRA